jgi:hypothetical protein
MGKTLFATKMGFFCNKHYANNVISFLFFFLVAKIADFSCRKSPSPYLLFGWLK